MMADESRDEPVEEIQRLRHEPAPDLLDSIRRSIQRRLLAAAAVELTWKAPGALLLEFVRMAFALIAGRKPEPEERDDA